MSGINNIGRGIIITLVIIIGALLYLQTDKGDEYFCKDFSQQPLSTLETGLIGDMVSIYRSNHLIAINAEMRARTSNSSYVGTKSITFEMDKLSKFFYQIQKAVHDNGYDLEKVKLGVRIYKVAYPKKTKWGRQGYSDLAVFLGNPITEDYENRSTLLFVPTIVNSNGEIVDFNPLDPTTYETGLTKYATPETYVNTDEIDNSPEAKVKILSLSGVPEDNTFSKNHGGLYPPYPEDGTGF
jgi:hypothetical protein